ncbi:class I adenylate-forming enzyme family protein [Glutamicibacter uratoxydans]|uniref:class I adenylate-forming enzyme family protein n=1 Tax=Glutamicibacter uratoxydans TaxID=43667 RepID=UPI003D7007F2
MELATTFVAHVRSHPSQLAVVSCVEALSYAQLYAVASDLAESFTAAATSRVQDSSLHRVGILCADPVDFMAGFLAGILSGCPVVVLDPSWPVQRLHGVIAELGLQHVLCDSYHELLLKRATPTLELIRAARPGQPLNPAPVPVIDPRSELVVVFTSGTTLAPKAISRSRSSWAHTLRLGQRILHAQPAEVNLIPGPLAHGLSLYAAFETLLTGGTALLTGRWDAQAAHALLRAQQCTRIVAVPSILKLLLDHYPSLLTSVRYVVSGGEGLPRSLRQQLQSLESVVDVVEYYGTSEHSLIAYRNSTDAPPPSDAQFAGQLFPEVQLRIIPPKPDATTGEIFVRSPMLASDYLNPDITLRRQDGYLSVNDYGKYCAGQLLLNGRAGGMLNLGGNNIYPTEIAQGLGKVLAVDQVQVLTEPVSGMAPRLIAFIEASKSQKFSDLTDLGERLNNYLPAYKVPHELVILSSWPRTESGKIATAQLLKARRQASSIRMVLR